MSPCLLSRRESRPSVKITPHEHVQERIVEQSVNVIVPPIVEGISADVQITPTLTGFGDQSVIVAVPPIVEGIPAFDQVTPREHFQKENRGTVRVCSRASDYGRNPGHRANHST